MKMSYKISLLVLIALVVTSIQAQASESKGSLSGFARLIAGTIDDESANYRDYDNKLNVHDSLIGIQGDFQYNSSLSFTAQVIGTPADSRKSGLEWLYVSYKPLHNLNFKLGKLRTPFYAYSDVLDVGFAYPWIKPPDEVYLEFVFSTFEGIDIRYDYHLDDINGGVELYYGSTDNDILTSHSKTESEFKDMFGVILELNLHDFRVRSAYHSGRINVILESVESLALTLAGLGFVNSANALDSTSKIDYFQFSVQYDVLDYFAKAEYVDLKPVTSLFSDYSGFYITAGMYVDAFTFHITASKRDDRRAMVPRDEIPTGVSEDLDRLAAIYDDALAERNVSDINSVAIGVRYDISPMFAVKAELKHMDINTNEVVRVPDAKDFNDQINLLLFGLEAVF